MVMQGVYQEFGFAEYPDVLTVIKDRMRENGNVSNAWYVFFVYLINACPVKLNPNHVTFATLILGSTLKLRWMILILITYHSSRVA